VYKTLEEKKKENETFLGRSGIEEEFTILTLILTLSLRFGDDWVQC
jgi:hypothetical protein